MKPRLSSLKIENFRMLENLEIKRLGNVNLIVGKNNSGKSTVLEALRVYAGCANPDLLEKISLSRYERQSVKAVSLDDKKIETFPRHYQHFFSGRKFPHSDSITISIGGIGGDTLKIHHSLLERYEKTMKTISDALLKKDYLKIETDINSDSATFKGFVFKNDAGYPDINIWIMPNNKDDGYLEYFIKDNIIENKKDKLQASLFEYAIDCFSKIPDKQVIQHRDIDKSKSEIATWLAFQKKPQYSLAAVVNLIDFTQHTAKNLMDWLKDTFPKTKNL
jgi:AAA15 family ATPase/GTPase